MKINPISNSAYKASFQNFKGIVTHGERAKEMVGEYRDILEAVSDAKDVNIYLFSNAYFNGEMMPGYAGIIQKHKDEGTTKVLVGFKRPATEDGLEDAKETLKELIVWTNPTLNLTASAAIAGLAKNAAQEKYTENLQKEMTDTYFRNERNAWEQMLGVIASSRNKK